MDKATAVQMRKSLKLVEVLKHSGIRFVPIPVFDDYDMAKQLAELERRLNKLEEVCGGK